MKSTQAENVLNKLQNKEAWFGFVYRMFSNLEMYADRYGMLDEVRDEIYEVADSIAEELWNDTSEIGLWEINHIRGCVFNNDNKENPSPGRILQKRLGELLRKIEHDSEFSHNMEVLALEKNYSDYDVNIMIV